MASKRTVKECNHGSDKSCHNVMAIMTKYSSESFHFYTKMVINVGTGVLKNIVEYSNITWLWEKKVRKHISKQMYGQISFITTMVTVNGQVGVRTYTNHYERWAFTNTVHWNGHNCDW